MEIPDPFIAESVRILSPFFQYMIAGGMATFFYLLVATDLIPKPDLKIPRERAFMVGVFVLVLVAFGFLLYVQIFQGGVLDKWFPW